MDRTGFLTDIERIPSTLADLARAIDGGSVAWPVVAPPRRILFLGMGSSHFAASAVAARLRAHGLDAVAELASAELTWPPAHDLLVVAISASGSSVETLHAVERHAGTSRIVALTNTSGSPLHEVADAVVDMAAGDEIGGVACRSFRHTVAALLVLESQLTGTALPTSAVRRAAAATEYLLDRRDAWLPEVLDALTTDDGTWFLAPVERLASALQGALMVREGPRRRADACETGDWSHVDVYLTKTLDYRALVFPGSRYDAEAARWMTERGSTAVAVHPEGAPGFPAAQLAVTYPGSGHPLVPLLVETTVAELVAERWFSQRSAT
jgi:glutamine---fructose-6-phosphate transaminase (isomerizing)